MFVETPQILWNAEGDKGINSALMSVSVLQSGIITGENNNVLPIQQHAASSSGTSSSNGHTQTQTQQQQQQQSQQQPGYVLATAGTTPTINLWNVSFPPMTSSNNNNNADNKNKKQYNHNQHNRKTKVRYLTSLTRHEMAVKTVAFSPDGLHLATGSDAGGALIIWSIPLNKRGNNNGKHFWSMLSQGRGESELTVRIVNHSSSGICDISWSADSKRFLAGTIDHAVLVCENVNYNSQKDEAQWRTVFHNGMDHTHYVLGCSYDPLGVYLASMSSDRSVRIYPRKSPRQLKNSNKKVLKPASSSNNNNNKNGSQAAASATSCQTILTDTKLEMMKSKQVKYRKTYEEDGTCLKQNLFADEGTLESFVRRLSWTADGAFLVTPCALDVTTTTNNTNNNANGNNNNTKNNSNNNSNANGFATCLFARHKWDEPCRILLGMDKPSIAVRPNPVLFQLPPKPKSAVGEDTKENKSPPAKLSTTTLSSSSSSASASSAHGLPYRSVFAVLTWDSVLIYDTYHDKPIAICKGIHYCQLVDATWTSDGHTLVVCSTDGYVSFLRFGPNELGQVYEKPVPNAAAAEQQQQQPSSSTASATATTGAATTTAAPNTITPKPKLPLPPRPNSAGIARLPPCEPGMAVVVAPPSKRSKTSHNTTAAEEYHDDIGKGVDQLSLHQDQVPASATTTTSSNTKNHEAPAPEVNELQPKKKKKRIQPVLVTMPTN